MGFGQYGERTYCFLDKTTTLVTTTTVEYLLNWMFHVKRVDLIIKVGGVRDTLYLKYKHSRFHDLRVCPQLFFGINYNFTRHVAIGLNYGKIFGYTVYSVHTLEGRVPDTDIVLVGLRFTFD